MRHLLCLIRFSHLPIVQRDINKSKNRNDRYDATAKLVNEEIAKLGDAGTFADLAGIDKKLGLPKGTSWEMGGYADWFTFEED